MNIVWTSWKLTLWRYRYRGLLAIGFFFVLGLAAVAQAGQLDPKVSLRSLYGSPLYMAMVMFPFLSGLLPGGRRERYYATVIAAVVTTLLLLLLALAVGIAALSERIAIGLGAGAESFGFRFHSVWLVCVFVTWIVAFQFCGRRFRRIENRTPAVAVGLASLMVLRLFFEIHRWPAQRCLLFFAGVFACGWVFFLLTAGHLCARGSLVERRPGAGG